MPTKKSLHPKKRLIKNSSAQNKKRAYLKKIKATVAKLSRSVKGRVGNLLMRRPHRSFQKTRRRDYTRTLKLPGYWSFTNYVRKTLSRHKKLFLCLVIAYFIITMALVGIGSQDTYNQISDTIRTTSSQAFQGGWSGVDSAGLLILAGISGGFNTSLDAVQQVYLVIIILFTWLATVWLLRAILAGQKPKLRDGLYGSGSPILSTFLVGLLVVFQLLPIAIAAIGFATLIPYGILDGGVESMLFWTAALLLLSLSLYWITSTLIALVVVTLPGMYPMKAIRAAGDLVIGRRVRILLRLLWLLLVLVVSWVLIMVPIVLFDTWIKGVFPAIQWLPLVPVSLAIMSTLTVVWTASYIYLLYRRVVDDDAAPA
jgi:hypothetical protein